MLDKVSILLYGIVIGSIVTVALVALRAYVAQLWSPKLKKSSSVRSMANSLTMHLHNHERTNVFVSTCERNKRPYVQVINVRTYDNVVYELSPDYKPIVSSDAFTNRAIHRLNVAVMEQYGESDGMSNLKHFVDAVYAC